MDRQITHKQHYVWREYLSSWGHPRGDKIFVWWNNKKVTKYTDLFDILREKDFYQFKPLNKLELFCLKQMFAKTNNLPVKNANKVFDDFVNVILKIDSTFEEKEEFTKYLIQAGEDIQSGVEKSGVEPLKFIKNENLSLFNYDENGIMIDFLIFVLYQFFRTKGNKENATGAVKPNDNELKALFKKEMNDNNDYCLDWDNVYNYGIHYVVNQVSYSLSAKGAHIRLLKSSNSKFIVSDQPVYNIAEDIKNDFDLYYPITPELAIIISSKYKNNEIISISDSEVCDLNYKTLKHAHNFIIGVERNYVDFNWNNI